MIRRLYRWHIKRWRFRLAKGSLVQAAPKKPRWFKGIRKRYYFSGDGYYVYEKSARRHFFRYLFLGLLIGSFLVWFLIESYRGWGIFS